MSPWFLLLLWPAFGLGVLVCYLLTRPRTTTYRLPPQYTADWREWPTMTTAGSHISVTGSNVTGRAV